MSSGANLFSLTGVGRLGFGSDRGGAGWCTGGTKITFEARMQLMTLMALMLEITTSTSTTTMELSAVTMGDENRVSPPPPFDGVGGFVVDRFWQAGRLWFSLNSGN